MSRLNPPYSPESGRAPSRRSEWTFGGDGREWLRGPQRTQVLDDYYGDGHGDPYDDGPRYDEPSYEDHDLRDYRGYRSPRYPSPRPQDGHPQYSHPHSPGDDRYDAAYDAIRDPAYEADVDDEIYEYYEPMDRRWIWVAGVAGAILLVAVICTAVILGGGDSGSVAGTVGAPASSSAPSTSSAPEPTASRPPVSTRPPAPLAPETVTTVTPAPSATLTPTPTVAPPVAPPPAEAAAPGTVTYSVTGTRSLLDLVTVIYTDAQGALQTDVNVALPWHKTVVLNPGVTLSSVTATSLTGQLNCAITDAAGTPIAVQTNNSMLTTCTR